MSFRTAARFPACRGRSRSASRRPARAAGPTSAGPKPRPTPPRPASASPTPTCSLKFSLTGSLGLQGDHINSLGDSRNYFWSFGPSVSWPLFDAGRIRSNINVRTAAQEEALLAYRGTILIALQDVENALVAFTNEQERRQSLVESVQQNRRAVDLSLLLYSQGTEEFLNVLNAPASLLVAEAALAESDRTVVAKPDRPLQSPRRRLGRSRTDAAGYHGTSDGPHHPAAERRQNVAATPRRLARPADFVYTCRAQRRGRSGSEHALSLPESSSLSPLRDDRFRIVRHEIPRGDCPRTHASMFAGSEATQVIAATGCSVPISRRRTRLAAFRACGRCPSTAATASGSARSCPSLYGSVATLLILIAAPFSSR